MYHFYVYLIILAIISPVVAYNRDYILKKMSISKEIMIISILILIFYGFQLLINKKDIMKPIDSETMKLLVINGLLTSVALYLGSKIIMKENVFKYKSIQKSVYLVALVIISACVYGQKLNIKTLLGALLVIVGAYLIDLNIK